MEQHLNNLRERLLTAGGSRQRLRCPTRTSGSKFPDSPFYVNSPLLSYTANLKTSLIGLEACSGGLKSGLAVASNLCEKFHQASILTPFLATTPRTKSVELVTKTLGRQSKITLRGT
jgi:hypothetical protein